MIKKSLMTLSSAVLISMSGCASHPTTGILFTNATVPVVATNNADTTKEGVSDKCVSILGIIAVGDCSINNAKTNGGIQNVSSVDYKLNNILGLVYTGQTIVKGN